MTDFLRADARMALVRYESSVAAFGMEAGFPMKDVRVVQEYIEQLEAALREMLEIVATHRVYVGNSPAGELACEWTMDAIKEIYAKMEDVIARKALEGKDDE